MPNRLVYKRTFPLEEKIRKTDSEEKIKRKSRKKRSTIAPLCTLNVNSLNYFCLWCAFSLYQESGDAHMIIAGEG
jgi:hypothetical protein